ncbi:hypothetical protein SteCoe_38256 [Stentor coeruleus]|uniref:RING-type domain-containing protein n=1 Tax=Stentor coeruleus TaxID=5963 RepID=A0A1R2ALL7_9CILI|nr:hypothetical protein SteCoe_38256 [Stentor coeruleus]
MSVKCESICMLCESNQDFKVNYTFTHGVCESHKTVFENSQKECTHCSISVKILHFTGKTSCALCKSVVFNLKAACGHYCCINCISETRICKSCFNQCENCSSKNSLKELNCVHKVCKVCMNNLDKCPLCVKNCNKCEEKPYSERFSCGHQFCRQCLREKNTCLMCPEMCESCHKSILWEELSCSHKVCDDCRKNNPRCPICHPIKVIEGIHINCTKCIIN